MLSNVCLKRMIKALGDYGEIHNKLGGGQLKKKQMENKVLKSI